MSKLEWRERAACRNASVDMFNGTEEDRAKAVCASCPVIKRCSELHRNEQFGVWFGTTAHERGYGPARLGRVGRPTNEALVRRVLDENPDRWFSIKEMASHARVSMSGAGKVLNELHEAEVLTVSRHGAHRVWKLR